MDDSTKDAKLEAFARNLYAAMSDDELRAIMDDEGERQFKRELALAVLGERERGADRAADDEAEVAAGIAERQAEREAAAAESLPADLQPVPAPDAAEMTENGRAALMFAVSLRAGGMDATPMRTGSVQGKPVKDGWTVNVHDGEHEIGFVACWWGRGHFIAYAEISGHRERSAEAASVMLACWEACKRG